MNKDSFEYQKHSIETELVVYKYIIFGCLVILPLFFFILDFFGAAKVTFYEFLIFDGIFLALTIFSLIKSQNYKRKIEQTFKQEGPKEKICNK